MIKIWFDHQFESNGKMHFFVETPRIIPVNENSSDIFPLHYFGMDFDLDGLNNFDG